MIVAFVITFILNTVRIVMDVLGAPVVSELPFGMDSAVSFMFGMVFALWNKLWFIQAPFLALVAFLSYKSLQALANLILGSRAPK